jgi:hypothetical protein
MLRRSLLIALLVCAVTPAAAHAGSFSFSTPLALPSSPPQGDAQGGEPGVAFEPNGDGWVHVVAPGARGGNGGINYWRSDDHGDTFKPLQIIGSAAGGSDSDVLTDPDGTLFLADLEVAATAVCRSKDHGKTFDNGCESGQASDQSGPVSDREWLNVDPRDPKTLFNTYDGLAQGFTPQVMVSHSEGDANTWQPCGQVLEPGSDAANHYSATGATENSEVIGRPGLARDGTMVVPFTLPNNQGQLIAQNDITESGLYVAVAKGGCQTTSVFHDVTLWNKPGSDLVSLFPALTVDAAGDVYVLDAGKLSADDKQQGVYLWMSRDGGAHFTGPTRISSADLGADQLVSIAAGQAPGELLAGWYGASNIKTADDSAGQWRYYMAESFDGGASWAQVAASPVMHYGNICNKGILCSGEDNRNLLDFTTVAVDPANGCAFAVFAGDPYNTPGTTAPKDAAAYRVKQTDGPCLIRGVASAAPASGSAPAPAGGCRDGVAPQSAFRSRRLRMRGRHAIVLRGRSADRGCGRLGVGRVTRVRVSIARVAGRRCRYLQPGGTSFTSVQSCLRTRYLTARGTTRWTLRLRTLPRGSYKLWVRGIDSAGNVEHKGRQRNFARLVVR